MAYWVRAYCTTETAPTIRSLLSWLGEQDEFAAAHAPGQVVRLAAVGGEVVEAPRTLLAGDGDD
jgi:hypothetical protein